MLAELLEFLSVLAACFRPNLARFSTKNFDSYFDYSDDARRSDGSCATSPNDQWGRDTGGGCSGHGRIRYEGDVFHFLRKMMRAMLLHGWPVNLMEESLKPSEPPHRAASIYRVH